LPGRNYSRLGEYISLGQNWTREHILDLQVNSPMRECLARASYAENKEFTNESNSSYYLRATMHASDD